jgi:tetratricopeptide (TPR) repeat protein
MPAQGQAESGAGGAQGGAAPMMGNPAEKKLSLTEAVAQAPKEDPSLVPAMQKYQAAQRALQKSPNDPAAKKAYVGATYQYAHDIEYGDKLSPMIRYRASLKLYRDALNVDPNHAPSLQEKNQIEEIYRTMPGGIPK